ncbi:MAG TPA: Ig-like domain-containing protein [Gemmatimonadales bacterium]|nr:Ig-like domain-containing protein [Gemmatimonadales bacterium]
MGVACADYVFAPGERAVRGIQLSPTQLSVSQGQSASILATILDQTDSAFASLPAGVSLTWASADTAVARVDATGKVTGGGTGVTQVTAQVSGDFGSFAGVATVTVLPNADSLALVAGDTQTARVGTVLPVPLAVRALNGQGGGVVGVPVTFTVTHGGGSLSDSTVVTDSSGLASATWTLGVVSGIDSVVARSSQIPGAVVRFSARALPGFAQSFVIVSGDHQTGSTGALLPSALVVQMLDRFGNGVPGLMIHWAITSGGGTVAPDSIPTDSLGLARAQWTLGATPDTQKVLSFIGDVSVTFSAFAVAPVATVTVTPPSPTLASGATVKLTATPKDSAGNPLAVSVAWASGAPTVASVDTTGLVTGHLVGQAVITASAGAKSGTDTVTVVPGPVSPATSVVSVSAPTVPAGDSVTLTLTTKDGAGNPRTSGGAVVTFTTSGGTSTGSIGPVTDHANGIYTAFYKGVASGTPTTVGATIGGLAVTTALPTVQVTAGTDTLVATVAVTPNPVTLASGATQQLTATAKNSLGTVLPGKPVSWSSSGPGVAAVDGTGLVTGDTAGKTAVTATVQGVAAIDTVTVVPGAPSRNTSVVTAVPASIVVGDSSLFTLVTKDAAGNPLTTGGHVVSFSVSGGSSTGTLRATVDHGDGTYTAEFIGTAAGTAVTVKGAIDALPPVVSTASVTVTSGASSHVVHWINPAGGSWTDVASWSPARVPGPQDTAYVDAHGVYQVAMFADSAVASLVIGTGNPADAPEVQLENAVLITGVVHVRADGLLDAAGNSGIIGGLDNAGITIIESDAALAIDSVGPRTAVNTGIIEGSGGGVFNVTYAIGGLVNHGTLSPGVPSFPTDYLTIAGNVTLASGSLVNIQVEGTGSYNYGVLGVTGTLSLGDTLRVTAINGWVPSVGDTYAVVAWGAFSGDFASVQLPALPTGHWQVTYLPVGLLLTVTP